MRTFWLAVISLIFVGCAAVNKPAPFGTTGHDDSNTANTLDSLNPASANYSNASYPSQLYNFASKEDANRYYEQGFGNSVSTVANTSACLGTSGVGLTMTPTSCVAYNAGYRGTETGSITFANNSTTWVAMDENTSGSNAGLPNFTRVSSTHYLIDAIDVSQPAMASDSQLLMKVVTSGGSITTVSDLRKTGAQLVSGLNTLVGSGTTPSISNFSINGVVNAQVYGAIGDLIYSTDGNGHLQDGSCSGTAFTSASGAFTSGSPAPAVGDKVIIDGAGAAGGVYVGAISVINSPTSITVSPSCSTTVSGAYWRVGFDNSSAFASAIAAVPNGYGTVFIPRGNYLTVSAVTLGKSVCNVTLEGDKTGTILMPYFSTGSAYGFIDAASENPSQCYGGIRNVDFVNVGTAPTSLNLIRVSDEQGILIENVRSKMYNGTSDNTILIDPGAAGGSFTTWTEQTQMINIDSFFTTNMLTFDGETNATFSVNNNTLTNSHCDPANSGSCLKLIRWTGSGALQNSYFEFNADLNGSGINLISTDHRADDWNGSWAINIRSQSLTTGTACFSAPASTGNWNVTGSVYCVGDSVANERNSNTVLITPNYKGTSSNQDAAVSVSGCGTSPTLAAGSTARAGEVTPGAGATACALTFSGGIGTDNAACTVADDGQPLLWYVSGKSASGVTFQCYNPATTGNCTASQSVNWNCTGF